MADVESIPLLVKPIGLLHQPSMTDDDNGDACCLLRCGAAWVWLEPTCRRNVSPRSSGLKESEGWEEC
jgi:hypothetical protein